MLDEGVWLYIFYYIYLNGIWFFLNGLIVKEGDSLIFIDIVWGELFILDFFEVIYFEIKLLVSKVFVIYVYGDWVVGVDVFEFKGIDVFVYLLIV